MKMLIANIKFIGIVVLSIVVLTLFSQSIALASGNESSGGGSSSANNDDSGKVDKREELRRKLKEKHKKGTQGAKEHETDTTENTTEPKH